jgi:hypothetical protein
MGEQPRHQRPPQRPRVLAARHKRHAQRFQVLLELRTGGRGEGGQGRRVHKLTVCCAGWHQRLRRSTGCLSGARTASAGPPLTCSWMSTALRMARGLTKWERHQCARSLPRALTPVYARNTASRDRWSPSRLRKRRCASAASSLLPLCSERGGVVCWCDNAETLADRPPQTPNLRPDAGRQIKNINAPPRPRPPTAIPVQAHPGAVRMTLLSHQCKHTHAHTPDIPAHPTPTPS